MIPSSILEESMKFSALYCNQEHIFPRIDFNVQSAEGVNVILAAIRNPKDKNKDSHNLGKTTLIYLLDFMLLKSIASSSHFLNKHADRFKEFVFYLEAINNQGEFITVRREVARPTKISLRRHSESGCDFTDSDAEYWDHSGVPLNRARSLLDAFFDLSAVKPWDYRRGLSYFLRTQNDFRDYFQLEKFAKGRHVNWKPYLAHIFGFDYTLLKRKYELDNEVEALKAKYEDLRREAAYSEKDINKLDNYIEALSADIEATQKDIDRFSFKKEEERINKQLAHEIEKEVSDLNQEKYNLSFDLDKLEESLENIGDFDVKEVQRVFEEANAALPESIIKTYENLKDFYKRLTEDRHAMIKNEIFEKRKRIDEINARLEKLDGKRAELMQIIEGEDAFSKFKKLQSHMADRRARIIEATRQREKVAALRARNEELREARKTLQEVERQLGSSVTDPPQTFRDMQRVFQRLVKEILGVNGYFFVRQNQEGNLDFEIEVESSENPDNFSSQAEGATYRKLLCALFDITVLEVYSGRSFYRFVYHDGIFEGLDNRKKVALMNTIRQAAKKYDIQYIFTAIQDDLPAGYEEFTLHSREVVRELHDKDKTGRLFRMAEF